MRRVEVCSFSSIPDSLGTDFQKTINMFHYFLEMMKECKNSCEGVSSCLKKIQTDISYWLDKIREMEAVVFTLIGASVLLIVRWRSTKVHDPSQVGNIDPSPRIQDTEIIPLNTIKKALIWKEYYSTRVRSRGNLRLVEKRRLTPGYSSRMIYHLAFNFVRDWESYEAGASLAVYPKNDSCIVDGLLLHLGIPGSLIVKVKEKGEDVCATVRTWLISHLDLFSKPTKKFMYNLSRHASSRYEQLKLAHLGTDDNVSYRVLVAEGTGYIDILRVYKSLKLTAVNLVEMLPRTKPRLYSISSSSLVSPSQIHLLVSVVTWQTPTGKLRTGQCSTFLASCKEGDVLRTELRPAMMTLPTDQTTPIVMAGLGTGIAPFRAFALDRKFRRTRGEDVGPIALYFGARYRKSEYLYGVEFDQLSEEQVIDYLRLAFSRDQEEKVYIQHLMVNDAKLLKELLGNKLGTFYLCGPTWPVPDIKAAINTSLEDEGAVDKLKSNERYKLEVY